MVHNLVINSTLTLSKQIAELEPGDDENTLFIVRDTSPSGIWVGWEGEEKGTFYTHEQAVEFIEEGSWFPKS